MANVLTKDWRLFMKTELIIIVMITTVFLAAQILIASALIKLKNILNMRSRTKSKFILIIIIALASLGVLLFTIALIFKDETALKWGILFLILEVLSVITLFVFELTNIKR